MLDRGLPGYTDLLVVGGGAAGLTTVLEARRLGFEGSITLAGDEVHLPYDRPPLSKEGIQAGAELSGAALTDSGALSRARIAYVAGARACHLDAAGQVVSFADGRIASYGTLVIATGVRSRTLADVGSNGASPLYLRTIEDCARLRSRLALGGVTVIAGAGFVGLEVAASIRRRAGAVVVCEPQTLPLADKLPAVVAQRVLKLHEDNGVVFRMNSHLADVSPSGGPDDLELVMLSDGSKVAARTVLCAVGSVPNTEWLEGSGVKLDHGVVVDEMCRAAPGVFAVGDVVVGSNPIDLTRQRVEHRSNAAEQAAFVARAVACDVGETYRALPFFWTDQYDVRLQMFGWSRPEMEVDIVDGALEGSSFCALLLFHGRPAGVVSWNSPKSLPKYRKWLLESLSP